MNMSVNGEPSPAEVSKSATDGVGSHSHGQFGPHSHGEPSFTDDEVAYMESKGNHVDRFHGLVYGPNGGLWTPLHVAAMLREAHREAKVKPETSEPGEGTVAKSVSGVREPLPVVQHLDLRQYPR